MVLFDGLACVVTSHAYDDHYSAKDSEIPMLIFELSLSAAPSAMIVCIINPCQHDPLCLSMLPDC